MKPEIKVVEKIIFSAKNEHTCRGQYYVEDDWSLVGEGSTIKEAIEDAVKDFLDDFGSFDDLQRFSPMRVEVAVARTETVVVDGKTFKGPSTSTPVSAPPDALVMETIKGSPAWCQAERQHAEELKKFQGKRQAEQEEADRKTYERLHEKFGPKDGD